MLNLETLENTLSHVHTGPANTVLRRRSNKTQQALGSAICWRLSERFKLSQSNLYNYAYLCLMVLFRYYYFEPYSFAFQQAPYSKYVSHFNRVRTRDRIQKRDLSSQGDHQPNIPRTA